MKLTHVGVSQYRSIGTEPVMIDLSKKITVLVGQNDCGKSNVLRGLSLFSKLHRGEGAMNLDEVDFHQRKSDKRPELRFIAVPDESDNPAITRHRTVTLDLTHGNSKEAAWQEIEELTYREYEPIMEAMFGSHWNGRPSDDKVLASKRRSGGQLVHTVLPQFPEFLIIPQFRRIENSDSYNFQGKGIIKLLAQWQHPDIGQDRLEAKFQQIQKLLQELLERPDATIEVPHSHKEIIVRNGTMRLPLESHGTGIHQLIILAIAVLSKDNVLFGIEEPEIHLHPLLQRRFIQFLKEETTNRYVITTHSPALIVPDDTINIVHLTHVDGVTTPHRVASDVATLAALDDLGVRPSDLLQANSVIWVEGPSDRIYLNHWIHLVDPDLAEGIDYSIMFYGGRLLSHLTVQSEETEEAQQFVRLLRINQRSAVVMDSDKKNGNASVNGTKERIQQECQKAGQFAWITGGREIENYLPDRVIQSVWSTEVGKPLAIKSADFRKIEDVVKTACEDAFGKGAWQPKWAYDAAKPAWAHKLVAEFKLEDMKPELREQIKALAHFIRRRP